VDFGIDRQMSVILRNTQEALKPEYADVVGVHRIFGIKPSFLRKIWEEDRIRSVLVPGRGRTRGKRLYDCESIRKYLAELREKTNN
jgi:hypothetical protein